MIITLESCTKAISENTYTQPPFVKPASVITFLKVWCGLKKWRQLTLIVGLHEGGAIWMGDADKVSVSMGSLNVL